MHRLISATSRRHHILRSISSSISYTRPLSVGAKFSMNVFMTHSFYGLHPLAPDMLNRSITWMYEQSRTKRLELPFLATMPVPSLLFRMGKDHTFGIPKAENT